MPGLTWLVDSKVHEAGRHNIYVQEHTTLGIPQDIECGRLQWYCTT